MKKSEVTELVAIIADAFTRPPMEERTVRVYEAMLLDMDREVAHRAICRLISTSKWLPTIAEIRTAAADLVHGATRLGGEAWGDVGEAVRRVGRYQVPTFDDPIVANCVKQMGWLDICNSTNDVADRARFIELYNGLAARARLDVVAGDALALPTRKPQEVTQRRPMELVRDIATNLGGETERKKE
jgi:hypothetical protein